MTKTREIVVWIDKGSISNLEDHEGYNVIVRNKSNGSDIKATLLVPEKEREATITETEFEVIFRSEYVAAGSSSVLMLENMKQKLFGETK
jgi:hypothetical protein